MDDVDPGLIRLLREELVRVSRLAFQRGLVPGVSGNNSLRVPGTDMAIIKATNCCQGDMTLEDTVLVTLDGEVLDAGRKPSKEWQFHLGLYKMRPEVGGVAHLHPPYTVAFAVANELPLLVTAASRGHLRHLDNVDLLPSGSRELADAVLACFKDPEVRGVLMREHGAVTVGPDLRTAFYRTDYLEDNAKVACIAAQIAGVRPSELRLAQDRAPLAEASG